jgi:hypothetical protein
MCFFRSSSPPVVKVKKTILPAAPQISEAPLMIQSTPAPARPEDMLSYKKKGKRGLVIPTTNINIPGA